MQPLSYQILPFSCWVTSMLNGLLVLHKDKNKISGLVYRLLHAVLTDEGVYTQGQPGCDLNTILSAIQISSGLKVRHYNNVAVANAICKLDFQRQVAVCGVDGGRHVILLTGREGGWIEAFDPDWDGVKVKWEIAEAYITQPLISKKRRRGQVNVLINENYLMRTRGHKRGGYHMGAVNSRTLTVLEKS